MVNIPEEYAALYLRLNGFLILTNFTHLSCSGHTKETDIIGLRCPNCTEKVDEIALSIDDQLFSIDVMNKNKVIPIICEVKGNDQEPEFRNDKIEYIKNFFGDFRNEIIFLGVSQLYDPSDSPIKVNDNRINIGLKYIVKCTKELVKGRAQKCKKVESWYMSGGLLQEILLFEENVPE